MIRLVSIVLILVGLALAGLGVLAWTSPPQLTVAQNQSLPPPPSETQPPAVRPDPGLAPGFDEPSFGIASTSSQPNPADLMRSVPIAHETPSEARFGQPFDVTLAIDATGAESAGGALPGRGNITLSEALVGADVRASLVGSAFQIEAMSPVDQAVSTFTANTWRWKVTPLAAGEHDLILEIYALQGNRALPVRTFSDRIKVKVSTLRQAITFAQTANPLFMVLGGIGSVLGGAFTALKFFSKATGRG